MFEFVIGQIYVLVVNWLLLVVIFCIVVGFKSLDNFVVVYGIVVMVMMVIMIVFVCVVMVKVWNWNWLLVGVIIVVFFVIDFGFFGVNLLKVVQGGWLLFGIGVLLFFLLMIWYKGCYIVKECMVVDGILLELFLQGLFVYLLYCVLGIVIYLIGNDKFVFVSLLYNLKYNKVLYEWIIFLMFVMCDILYVCDDKCQSVCDVGGGLYIVKVEYGFNEMLDVKVVFEEFGCMYDMMFELMDMLFFFVCEMVVLMYLLGMLIWCEWVFVWMYQNVVKLIDFFVILVNCVVEFGMKIEI